MATHRIRRIDPVQIAKVAGVIYGLLGLIFTPIFVFVSMAAPSESGAGIGLGLAVAIPLLYGAIGAVGTLIAAALYNLVAGWVGGIEIELEP